MGFPSGSEVKASACNAGDPGSIPGPGRSPGEGNGYPHQYSCLENSTLSQTCLSTHANIGYWGGNLIWVSPFYSPINWGSENLRNSSDRDDKGGCPEFRTDWCWTCYLANTSLSPDDCHKTGLGRQRCQRKVKAETRGGEEESAWGRKGQQQLLCKNGQGIFVMPLAVTAVDLTIITPELWWAVTMGQ